MDVKYKDFFINIKRQGIPPEDTSEYKQLIQDEIEKCTNGVTVDGVFFSGWLYWHLNHWWIRVDQETETGNIIRVEQLPDLRDNEWIRAESIEICRKAKKGYMEIGLRQAGKSELIASFLGYNAILFKNTQNVVVGGNDPDLNLLKDKLDFGLKMLWNGISIPRMDKSWRGNTVRLGYKLPNGDDEIWSYLIIRNAADGKNTETAAGTTAKSYIMDEVGKYPFAKVYSAAKPAFDSKFGLRAIPMLIGTGGSFEKGMDAERFFYHPEENGFQGFFDPETNKTTALFMSGIFIPKAKYETNLASWLRLERGFDIKEGSDLENIKIEVADKEKAIKLIHEARELKRKDPDQSEYLKVIMYHPLTPEECFLTASDNIFNTRAAKARQQFLYDNDIVGSTVELYHDGETIKHKTVDKKPISKFPHNASDDKDAPIVMWEAPMQNAPFGLYVAGVDSYKFSQSKYSNSLGAVYIFKRMHDIGGEKFQDAFVAAYVARPEDKEKWNEQARLLIKYYNARTLVENDEVSFIDYMKAQGDAQYLERQPQWLKEIVPNTDQRRDYGISRSSERIRSHLHGCLKTYLNQKLHIEREVDTGAIISETLGVSLIRDPMLLQEIITFNEEDNFDRIIAAELALGLAAHLNPILKVSSLDSDPRLKSLFDKKKQRSGGLFDTSSNIFSGFKSTLF